MLSPDDEVRRILYRVAARQICCAPWEIFRFTTDLKEKIISEPNMGAMSVSMEVFELFDRFAAPHAQGYGNGSRGTLTKDLGSSGNRSASRYIRCAFGLVADMGNVQ